MAAGWPPAARRDGADLGCGHLAGRATLTGHTDGVKSGGGGAGWQLAGHRRRGRDGADLGRGHRQERATLTGHTGRVEAVAVAPDGSWLATGGQDGTVRIWDAATGSNGPP